MSKLERPKSNKKLVNNLYKWKDDLERRIEEKRNAKMAQEVSFDIKTGQKLFQPVINTNVDAHNKYRFMIK